MTLEQLKDKARKDLSSNMTQKDMATVDKIIDSTHQATVEEIIKLFDYYGNKDELIRVQDVVEMIKAIKK